jgi:hypothetical protein
MADLLKTFRAASAAHCDAIRACRAARRAGAPADVRDALRAARKAAMAEVRRAYQAVRAA